MVSRFTRLFLLMWGLTAGSAVQAQVRLWPVCMAVDTVRQRVEGLEALEVLPVLRGEVPWAAALDAMLKEKAHAAVAAFIDQNNDPEFLDPDMPMQQEGEWVLEWATPRLVSLRHTSFAYLGGAHPTHQTELLILSWNGKDLLEVTLDRLLKWSPALEKALRRQSSGHLRLLGSPEAKQKDWKGLSASRLKLALPTRIGLLYHFDPYEVGSYADGAYTFIIPWGALGQELPASELLKQELWK